MDLFIENGKASISGQIRNKDLQKNLFLIKRKKKKRKHFPISDLAHIQHPCAVRILTTACRASFCRCVQDLRGISEENESQQSIHYVRHQSVVRLHRSVGRFVLPRVSTFTYLQLIVLKYAQQKSTKDLLPAFLSQLSLN